MKYYIDYKGTQVSTNIVTSRHWSTWYKKKKTIKHSFTALILQQRMKASSGEFEIYLQHNTKFDVDNCAMMLKWFIDCLRTSNVVPEDHKKYMVEVRIMYDKHLPQDAFRFTVNLDCNNI